MKTTFLRSASRCLAVSALVLAMGHQPAAWAGSHHSSSKRITGSWNARVSITNCLPGNVPGPIVFASFDAMNVYAADGTFLDTNAGNPVTQSAHFGYWRHIRGNRYEFAQRFFLFDAAGVATGSRIVRHQVLLDRTGLSFTSGGYAETFNTDGVLLATGCSTSTAVRFD
jgi:hypothetical protein